MSDDMFVPAHPQGDAARDDLALRLAEAEAERERFRADHLRACETIAAMHAAAVGRSGAAPRRGVVEDVVDVRARMLAAEQALVELRPVRAADDVRLAGAGFEVSCVAEMTPSFHVEVREGGELSGSVDVLRIGEHLAVAGAAWYRPAGMAGEDVPGHVRAVKERLLREVVQLADERDASLSFLDAPGSPWQELAGGLGFRETGSVWYREASAEGGGW